MKSIFRIIVTWMKKVGFFKKKPTKHSLKKF